MDCWGVGEISDSGGAVSDKRNVIIMEQPQTEVYVGDTGYIVVRQTDWRDENMTVLIDPANAEAIAQAILDCKRGAVQAFAEWKESGE